MAQFQVPQFIETEDKIIGPFTLKQFLYVGSAGVISFFLFFLLGNMGTWFMISLVLVSAAGALAFIKINGRELPKVLLSAFFFIWNPQTYVWKPDQPHMQKSKDAMQQEAKKTGLALDQIIYGTALKQAWHKLQSSSQKKQAASQQGRYEVLEDISGQRKVAKRVDY